MNSSLCQRVIGTSHYSQSARLLSPRSRKDREAREPPRVERITVSPCERQRGSKGDIRRTTRTKGGRNAEDEKRETWKDAVKVEEKERKDGNPARESSAREGGEEGEKRERRNEETRVETEE